MTFKKFAFIVVIILLTLSFYACNRDEYAEVISESVSEPVLSSQDSASVVSSAVTASSSIISTSSSAVSSRMETPIDNGDWKLRLINKTNLLTQDITSELGNITSDTKVDARCLPELKAMVAAAKKDGINFHFVSGYRTLNYQKNLFERNVNNAMKNEGLTRAKAEEIVSGYSAPPGTSEHCLGLAVDIVNAGWFEEYNNLNENFEKTDAFKWLFANSAEYGFVLRYPKDKVQITQINYEPWHYRYVGKDNALLIKQKGYCLEEYVKLLS